MPKKTFFNLPTDKQNTVIQSATKEFSRVPLHEASIANIIQDAGIPRGSFYRYFEDKEDLYYYLLNNISQKNHDRFITFLKENDGDIFATFIDSFQFMIRNHRSEEHHNFFRNTFLNMNYKTENILAHNLYEERQKNQYLEMIRLIRTETLNLENEQELHHLFKIIIAITFQNFTHLFVKDLTNDEAMERYIQQIELLKRGVDKQ